MNKAIILGRLTRDPEVRYTQNGKVVAQFTLAVDRPFTSADGRREADFINVVVWGKVAEICGNSLAKGHRALVEGRLQTRSYDGKDGAKRYVTEIIANSVEFIEHKGYTPNSGGNAAAANSNDPATFEDFGEGARQGSVPFDEEIPF